MDRTTLARKLREALFDHIEAGRRDALQDGAIDALFESVLASCERPTLKGSPGDILTWTSAGSFSIGDVVLLDGHGHTITGISV